MITCLINVLDLNLSISQRSCTVLEENTTPVVHILCGDAFVNISLYIVNESKIHSLCKTIHESPYLVTVLILIISRPFPRTENTLIYTCTHVLVYNIRFALSFGEGRAVP